MMNNNLSPSTKNIPKDTKITVDIPDQFNLNDAEETTEPKGLFMVKPASEWIEDAKERPIPLMLFGEFWHEGEICVLFADTNMGKSILAVQIANSISNGHPIPGFKIQAARQKVIYFDFELSDKQFEARYSQEFKHHYQFNDYFFRAEIDPDQADPSAAGFNNFEDYLHHSLEQAIIEKGAKIIIIDNITYLKSETERAKHALPLMKQLKALKRKYNLSIMALAHTPKRDLSKAINRNDLQGSKMIINFCDSSFAIGESSQDKTVRYLKQIKARNTEILYDAENVCVCQISKPQNFLLFEFYGFGTEREHLKVITDKDKAELEQKIVELKQTEPGISNREIAIKLGTNHSKVNRTLKKLKDAI